MLQFVHLYIKIFIPQINGFYIFIYFYRFLAYGLFIILATAVCLLKKFFYVEERFIFNRQNVVG